jgi:outer membrane protein OmpA-like peptidoglycan-associated protein
MERYSSKLPNICRMIRYISFLLIINILINPIGMAKDKYTVAISGGVGLTTRNSGAPPWFGLGPQLHFAVNTPLRNNWRLEAGFAAYKFYDNSATTSQFSLNSSESESTRLLKGLDFTLLFRHDWYPFGDKIGFGGGLGIGLSNWRIADPETEITLVTTSERGATTEFSASEIFLAGAVGVDYQIGENWKINFDIRSNYSTGAGLEFDRAVEDSLGRWRLGAGVSLCYLIGGKNNRSRRTNIRQHPYTGPDEIIAIEIPGDSIKISSATLISDDSDGDGIPDSDDNCPDTPLNAIGRVDICGCPIDSDADGYPDYLDKCPYNPRGAIVDIYGCALDGDKDGVPDGLDNCPDTRPGMKIDETGCVDLNFISRPTVLNIKYRPESFEIDPITKQKLDSIADILIQAPTVKIEAIGYTDNIGAVFENKKLSERRANRVRDYLVSLGIDTNRITTKGLGASNFIASNDTEIGRQKNSRVELIYSK